MLMLVGLGNPEDKYDGTRHNLGFEVLNHLVHKLGNSKDQWETSSKFKAQLLKTQFEGQELLLVKPQTYMNLSGLAVSPLAKFYKVSPENIVVIHDDLDLKLGQIKIRLGGGTAGHHGVESVIEKLGTPEFARVRLGIGTGATTLSEHGNKHLNVEHFVVEPFMANERSTVKRMIKRSIEAIETLIHKGLPVAQNQFN